MLPTVHLCDKSNNSVHECMLLWPPYHIGQAIIFLPCGFFLLLFLSFFPHLISAAADWMSPYFYTWCGPSANLECRSEMYCTQLAGNAGPKKSSEIRYLSTITQLCPAISSQLRHMSTIRKELVKQQYLLHMSLQYGELLYASG